MQLENTKTAWIENARAIAIIAVIVVHVAAPAVTTEYNPHLQSNSGWWVANLYDSFARFCVPVFVMITGSLLLPQEIGLKDFLKKRVNRILIPFLFWSIVYIAFNMALTLRYEAAPHFPGVFKWISSLMLKGAAIHLWYIHMLIGLYLFIPVLKPWIRSATNKEILFFIAIWLLTLIFTQQSVISIRSPLGLVYFSGYIGYLVLGYYLSERVAVTNALRKAAPIIFALGVIVTFAGTLFSTKSKGAFANEFYEFLSLNVFLSSIGMFLLVKTWRKVSSNTYFVNVRNIISRYGFGIYLNHLLMLSVMSYFHIDYSLFTPAIGIPLSAIICLLLSCMVVFLLRRIPYGTYISG